MKEEPYNKDDQESFSVAENNFFATIRHDKDQVWERIEERIKKKKVIPFWYYSVAASLLILLGVGLVFNYLLREKDNQIEKLQAQLHIQNSYLAKAVILENKSTKQTDTLIAEYEKIIPRTLITLDTLIIHDTINNIVIETDTIYIRENGNVQIADNAIKKEEKLYEKNYIEANQTYQAKKKNRRFIFKFGKHDNETVDIKSAPNDEPGLITLRSK